MVSSDREAAHICTLYSHWQQQTASPPPERRRSRCTPPPWSDRWSRSHRRWTAWEAHRPPRASLWNTGSAAGPWSAPSWSPGPSPCRSGAGTGPPPSPTPTPSLTTGWKKLCSELSRLTNTKHLQSWWSWRTSRVTRSGQRRIKKEKLSWMELEQRSRVSCIVSAPLHTASPRCLATANHSWGREQKTWERRPSWWGRG